MGRTAAIGSWVVREVHVETGQKTHVRMFVSMRLYGSLFVCPEFTILFLHQFDIAMPFSRKNPLDNAIPFFSTHIFDNAILLFSTHTNLTTPYLSFFLNTNQFENATPFSTQPVLGFKKATQNMPRSKTQTDGTNVLEF